MERFIERKLLLPLSAVLVGAILGCGHRAGHVDEAVAVAAIQKLGGKVEFDGPDEDKRVVKVYLHSTAVQDHDLSAIEKLPKLKTCFSARRKSATLACRICGRQSSYKR